MNSEYVITEAQKDHVFWRHHKRIQYWNTYWNSTGRIAFIRGGIEAATAESCSISLLEGTPSTAGLSAEVLSHRDHDQVKLAF
jgi:hypothetical protein